MKKIFCDGKSQINTDKTDSSPKDKKWWKPNISWLKLDKWVKRLDIYIIKKFEPTFSLLH